MAKAKLNTAQIAAELAEPILESMGLRLWDVRFEKEGSDWFLRVFIDKDNEGVYIDECVDLSRAVDPLLDEADPIKQSYNFEVSSAGLGRKLTKPFHFEKKMGQEIRARLIRAVDGVKEVKGTLTAFNDGVITITKEDGTQQDIVFKDTSFVKLCDDEDLF